MFAAIRNEGAFSPDALLGGDSDDIIAIKVVIAAGAGNNLKRGHVLGKITASGKYTLALAASNDGSQVPDVILAHDVDATAGDVEAMVYIRIVANKSAVLFGAGLTVVSTFDVLRTKCIFLI